MSDFAYIGQALTGAEFVEYLKTYDFGPIAPSFPVIHNTYSPDASWAPISTNQSSWWDRNESGLSTDDIIAKRLKQLDGIMYYYRDTKGWNAGPHLFIDEKWIWLFTPMDTIGIHAASGNSYNDANGLHYSIGIETVGYFEYYGWPKSMQKLLQICIQSLKVRLGNFDIIYTEVPKNRPDLHDHQISFHNDYNKDACPGAVITPAYAIPILQKPFVYMYDRYTIHAPCSVFTARAPDSPLAGGDDNGQTQLYPGDIVNVGDVSQGWLWTSPPVTPENPFIKPGIGYIPASYAKLKTK